MGVLGTWLKEKERFAFVAAAVQDDHISRDPSDHFARPEDTHTYTPHAQRKIQTKNSTN